MPYSMDKPDDLPDSVKKYPKEFRGQWVEVFNSAHSACMKDKKEGVDCEAKAFAMANGVVGKRMRKMAGKLLLLTDDEAVPGDFDSFEDDEAGDSIKVGMRNSGRDQEMIQAVHDTSVRLGAQCGEGKSMQFDELTALEISAKAMSLSHQERFVRQAWYKKFGKMIHNNRDEAPRQYGVEESHPHVVSVFPDKVIAMAGATYWAYPYEQKGTEVEFGEPVQVEQDWKPIGQMGDASKESDLLTGYESDILVSFGGAVKSLDDEEEVEGEGWVGGYLVKFGDAQKTDLSKYRDFFEDDTDFDVDWSGEVKSTVYFSHGLDKTLRRTRLGVKSEEQGATKAVLGKDNVGVWIKHQLDLRNEYERAIHNLVKQGKLGWSSGTAIHLVGRERKPNGAHKITYWPLGLDASLTPIPAEPTNEAMSLKSLFERLSTIAPADVEDKGDSGESDDVQRAVLARANAVLAITQEV